MLLGRLVGKAPAHGSPTSGYLRCFPSPPIPLHLPFSLTLTYLDEKSRNSHVNGACVTDEFAVGTGPAVSNFHFALGSEDSH